MFLFSSQYSTVQKFGSSFTILKEINAFIQQGHIKLMQSYSKDILKEKKKKFVVSQFPQK